jgi:type II secretory pathway pseudopilin PulG
MSEMVVTISVIGVLASISISAMSGVLNGSKESIARDRLEMLNQALNTFAYSKFELTFTPIAGSSADEMAVLRFLQYRDPNENRASTGSPYVTPRYNPLTSSSTDDFRIVWKGSRYSLLREGESGTGLKVGFDGSDFTTPYIFPPDWDPKSR